MNFFEEHYEYVKSLTEDTSPGAMAGFYISLLLGLFTIIFIIYIEFFM